MTSYTAITNGEIDQDSPITQPLMTALRDNCIAISESDTTAPLAAFSWQIEDGAGGTDPIWSQAVDGNQGTITSPAFASGWEYALMGKNVSLDDAGVASIQVYRDTPADYSGSGVLVTTAANADVFGFFAHVRFPMWSQQVHMAVFEAGINSGTVGSATANNYYYSHSSDTTLSRFRLIVSTGPATVYDGGEIYLLKRAEYGGR